MRLETERLILRPWEDRDRAPFAAIMGDPHVRRFYTTTLTAAETGRTIDAYMAGLARDGFSFMAVERKSDGALVGELGLGRLDDGLGDALLGRPEVEIGWIFGQEFWGQGYAPEAARACLEHAFGALALPEVVAFTHAGNTPSQRVMQKIGMSRDPEGDFLHPRVPEGHPIRPHVLYRIANPATRS